jgi:hypothetical protein
VQAPLLVQARTGPLRERRAPLRERESLFASATAARGELAVAARAVASAWERFTRGRFELPLQNAIHVLREVIEPPRWPRGSQGSAEEHDRELRPRSF